MLFEYAYGGSSSVRNDGNSTGLSFSPDLKREQTFFRGELAASVQFREAISALHDVVVSDLRFQPKDRTAYLEWYEKQQWIDFEKVAGMKRNVAEKISGLREELTTLERDRNKRWQTFYSVRQQFWNYLYKRDYDAWFVFDPVITVHPDQLFFECFSEDESSYGCLATDYSAFNNVGDYSCGTTNIDYSASLYNEFQKIRSYKKTEFEVDPSGFTVETENEDDFKEVKIDLPESWVRGFLQVNSAMCLDMVSFDLSPIDIHNMCFILRRKKEKKGPRSMRFSLKPGEPIRILFEPWNQELVCSRSIYTGDKDEEIRIWGRRRIHILERLIPIAKRFSVRLLGTGMPSFYVVDLGGMTFTLGLSGWTANDWSRAGNFDLMAPRANVDDLTKLTVFKELSNSWFATPEQLASSLAMDRSTVLGALGVYAQAGRVVYDLQKNVFRLRELSREPLPMDQLRYNNPREETAAQLLADGKVNVKSANDGADGKVLISGSVNDRKGYRQQLTIDKDECLAEATCECNFYQQNRLRKGPCEHMLALRLAYSKLERTRNG